MKLLLIGLAFFSLASLSYGQEKGIFFEQRQNWRQIKAKARAENKLIFIDVYATWCGSCKHMDKEVYPSEKLGEFINSKYISVKVQSDQTVSDNETVKSWYDDAKKIITNYKIDILPTLLVFYPDGKLVNRSSGYIDVDSLLKFGKKSLDIKRPYFAKLDQFEKGNLSPEEQKSLVNMAKSLDEKEIAQKVADNYINNYLFKLSEGELFTKDNLKFIYTYLGTFRSKAFEFFMKESTKINQILGRYKAQYAIMDFIEKNYLPNKENWKTIKPNWDDLEKVVYSRFGLLGEERVWEQRMAYYCEIQDWENYGKWYYKYFEKYLKTSRLSPNVYSWTLFENVEDKDVLKFACDTVMPYTIERWYSGDFQSYDTYANLLYKIGRKEKAIIWEEKAVKVSNNDKEIIETLEKMKRNEKTWPETAAKP